MHLSFFLIALLIGLGLAIITVCLWLALKLFGLKTDKASLTRVVGLEATFLTLTGLAGFASKGNLTILFNLLYLIGGVVLWAMLLKRFVAKKYSLGRAIGSYIASYVLATALAVFVSVIGIALFAQVFKVDGNSMAPTLKADQSVLVYKFNKNPHKNDVIVYTNKDTAKQVLGRVEGTPGETVTVTAGSGVAAASVRKLDATQYYITTDNTSYHIPNRIIKADNIIGVIGPKL